MNCLIFLGAQIKVFFPYFYAFYSKREKFDESEYDAFIRWLRVLLEKNGMMGRDICEEGFEFYASYFKDKPEILEQKVAYAFYIVRDYLDGLNKEFDYEFTKVKEYIGL